jgi:hypothetical protein
MHAHASMLKLILMGRSHTRILRLFNKFEDMQRVVTGMCASQEPSAGEMITCMRF